MKFSHNDLMFELPDAWLKESSLSIYNVTSSTHYIYPNSSNVEIIIIPLSKIVPLYERAKNKGVFCNNTEHTAKERVFNILNDFNNNAPIEPVKVVTIEGNDDYEYKLVHGSHRLHCSIIFGFTEIPAKIGFDITNC